MWFFTGEVMLSKIYSRLFYVLCAETIYKAYNYKSVYMT